MNIEYKDKLNIIQNSVYNIKNAIIEKGVQIAENEDITTFAEKISRISGGGGGETEREIILSVGDSFDFNFKIKLKDIYQKSTFYFNGEVDDPANPGEGYTVKFNIDCYWNDWTTGIYLIAQDPYGNIFGVQCDGEWLYFTTTYGESFEIITIQINLPIYYI